MNVTIKQVTFHRNGVGGAPFYVVSFTAPGAVIDHNMIGIVFDQMPGAVAVIDVDFAARGIISPVDGNAWRGDKFEAVLREAIEHNLVSS